MKKLLIFFLGTMLLNCDPVDDKLIVSNASDDTVYFVRTSHDEVRELYDAGLDELGIETSYTNYVKEIAPNTKQVQILTGGGNAWERYIRNSDHGKLHVYTFQIDTLKKYGWKTLTSRAYYPKKMEFSVRDLEQLNW
jgi:hypothetical protein